jgi:hypothetical protein
MNTAAPSIPFDAVLEAAPAQSSAPQPKANPEPSPNPMPSGWSRFARMALRITLMTFAIAGVAAIGFMLFGWQMAPSDAGSMVVQVDGVTVHDAINNGPLAVLGMWLLITLGLVLGFSMVLLGVSAALLMVMCAFAIVGLVGLLLASPSLLMLALIVWVLRKAFGSPKAA